MRTLGHIIPSHLLDSSDIEIPEWAQGRTVHARRLNMVPVEAVVRGYLTGSSWQEYQQTGYVYGHKLEPGMLEASKLASPLFTPTTKSIKHDEPLRTWDAYVRHLGGDERLACRIKDVAVRLFEEASRLAEDKGIIIADTKFEFGIADSGELVLADEVLTPDSSRFWMKKDHRPGTPSQSLDKQYIRDFLTSNGLKGKSGAVLPDHVIRSTVERYTFVLETLTGRKSEFR